MKKHTRFIILILALLLPVSALADGVWRTVTAELTDAELEALRKAAGMTEREDA